jgi:sacsin
LRALRRIAGDGGDINNQLLKDLKATYDYLSLHLEQTGPILLQHKDEELFLNVDDLKHKAQWDSASKLIFNASDDANFREVREFLRPYESLILQAGGKKITAAPHIKINKSGPDETLALWRGKLNRMRLNGYFIDVVFADLSDGEHGAHRVLLVCFGDFFTTMLCDSGMKEAHSNSFSNGEIIRIKMGYDCATIRASLGEICSLCFSCRVDSLLDFIYTGSFVTGDEPLEVQTLLDVLKLSDYWQIDDLKYAAEEALVPNIDHNTFSDSKLLEYLFFLSKD